MASRNDDPAGMASNPPEGMASKMEEDDPKPYDISRIPIPPKEEIEKHEKYEKYVKMVVNRWLIRNKDEVRLNHPKYRRTALTNFIFMILLSSFLEIAKDAARAVYSSLHGHRTNYFEDTLGSKWMH